MVQVNGWELEDKWGKRSLLRKHFRDPKQDKPGWDEKLIELQIDDVEIVGQKGSVKSNLPTGGMGGDKYPDQETSMG